jgi:hypothetical protein
MCRNCLFSAKDRLSLDRMGLSDRVVPRHLGTSGTWSLVKSWTAFVAWGLLGQLAAYHRRSSAGRERWTRSTIGSATTSSA